MVKGRKRVVVTGMGAVTPLGSSVEDYWSSLVAGKSGIRPMTLADPTDYPCKVSGEVPDFDPAQYVNPKEARRMARFTQLAVAAAALAIEDADLNLSKEDSERLGVVIGNGNGGFPTTEEGARVLFERGGMKLSPFFIPMILPNMAAANVSRLFGLKGYTSTVITACAAGNQGIGEGTEAIRRGAADVILAGGCEAGICELGLGGFNVIKALSRREGDPTKASRPFDADRDGFVPAEGAGILMLESLEHATNRGANILAEIVGYAVSSDAFHAVQPDEDGSGAARAMKWAIENAGLGPNDIDYINAHGTSTPMNDLVETLAIKKTFGEQAYKVPISSTKSMIGHALGGAGAIEAVACIQSIRNNQIHPTINYETPDPDCDLDYVPNKARSLEVNNVLSNSFGFGGQNACVVFSRFEE
ncbi:MAG: beta-ketoacyl-ACP synthase II [Chloroflexi bacterium]|nr:beta-ketoacyl-ACP synthase II [Chloroflexota bacterium]MCH8868971.1 beta-ketoacyl-ACP synthase II [Chloroflexota bacterium]MCH9038541.1 beta-ketoacyl-ACP synthase II [Chloroflexota bacterium]MCI0770599.1 beta-ketoacyl-ACP synthase II [Chloroflexota bacterium]MCI0790614.1 beta-ketoacyl-ACP synthase II [Chloroflexota bacterium]